MSLVNLGLRAAIGLAALAACACDTWFEPEVSIRRTSYGVPHIQAHDLTGLGFGQGYAAAEDYVCTIADQIVKLRSQRAQYFGRGPDDVHLDTDFAYLALDVYADAERALPGLPADIQALVRGYAAGYNQYLQSASLPDACRNAAWVVPMREADVLARGLDVSLVGPTRDLLSAIARAAPPSDTMNAKPGVPMSAAARDTPQGSNGWGLGSQRTESGRGLLLANPHLPWVGEFRLHEAHLSIPGSLDAYGASLIGLPGLNIGFNKHVAWTHTTSPSIHTTLSRLRLTPTDTTSYMLDDVAMPMEARTFEVRVRDEANVSRTLYRTQEGPLVNITGLGWSNDVAYALRDTGLNNTGVLNQMLRVPMAENIAQLEAATAEHSVPWNNTIAVDAHGATLYLDSSRVPALAPAVAERWQASLSSDPVAQLVAANGIALLDGSSSQSAWRDIVPLAAAPRLETNDVVFNSNDSAWVPHPTARLTGYSPLYRATPAPLTPRSRKNLQALSGGDRFSLDDVKQALLHTRGITAELLQAELVERCRDTSMMTIDDQEVDLSAACDALARWDGVTDTTLGARVWREFLGGFAQADVLDRGLLFEVPFDPADPLGTPHSLRRSEQRELDPVLVMLAEGVKRLQRAGLDRDETAGAVQYATRGDERIPVAGCINREGCLDVSVRSPILTTTLFGQVLPPLINATSSLSEAGYAMNFGSSFVLIVEYTDAGPRAEAIVTHDQSDDPRSAHFNDQTKLWSKRELRPVLFDEADIRARELSTRTFTRAELH